jgi:ATP-binding cassette subfamily B protein
MKSFVIYKQLDAMDCGPTCLRMVAKHYNCNVSLEYLRNKSEYGKNGVNLLGIADAAESIGFKTVGAKISYDQLMNEAALPAILYWDQKHFVVVHPRSFQTKRKIFGYSSEEAIEIADPAIGLIRVSKDEFLERWISTYENGMPKGIALLLEPTPLIKKGNIENADEPVNQKIGWRYLFTYVKQNRGYFVQIFLGLLIGSLLQLIFPYLTQSIVDTGVATHDLTFIKIILAAQLMLLFSQTVVEFIRSQILMHISVRINISLLSGFWTKLLKLPMEFFDSKHPGDILQRINDHHRIEKFLTENILSTLFSIFNIFIFSIVLLTYSTNVFLIFLLGSLFYLLWIRIFLKYRRQLDYTRFKISAKEYNASMQLVNGMQEIKLNNAENLFRWSWESLQAALFKIGFKSLTLTQYQQMGAFLINQSKNVLMTFVVAKLVVEGTLTLGMMLAIQYIIGQLNSPIEQLISFSQSAQDAKISLERLNDIHQLESEEPDQIDFLYELPNDKSIYLNNLSFTYPGAGNEPVLRNINLEIPAGKITAIVGMSGSGKTTLVKILLRFYENYKGEIKIGKTLFRTISPRYWRSVSGAVMQDSYIFNDSIRKNVTLTPDRVVESDLIDACKTANILDYIQSLPLGFHTKIGAEGSNMSGGQKQRLVIARSVYKRPQFVFFDEATNSLDANNEKVILENLQLFFQGKTVVVVAHRLSTVKNADKIVVMENGEIAEEGTHDELTRKRGKYYELVKNQLELGN